MVFVILDLQKYENSAKSLSNFRIFFILNNFVFLWKIFQNNGFSNW